MIIYNNLIPFKGWKAITLWPFIFVRKDVKFNDIDLNHEKIHLAQQIELLVIPFYIIYLIEWIFKGYRQICFEKEAYNNENNLDYLKTRKHYNYDLCNYLCNFGYIVLYWVQ